MSELQDALEDMDSIIDENIYLREELLAAQKEVSSLQLKLQGMFAVKLSEVAKVENRVRICNDMDSRWYAFKSSWYGPKFETELEAIKWAEENGYHV
ncbi:MAG: hypothetical protein EOO06_00825 [Chitinophagaceae bacterium]|nr:MAG: hypothetical protein EOO06_00825 [Chitinophagaceae bacterium]